MAAVLPDHFQQPGPLGGVKMKIILDGLCTAVKNYLDVMKRPLIKRDPINRMEAEAWCPPLDTLRYRIIRVEDSQPQALDHGLQRMVQRLKERINQRVSI